MLDAHSPLGMTEMFSSRDTTLSEAPGFTLTQVAGDEKALKKIIKLPFVRWVGHLPHLDRIACG